jgi:hypothetical protein
MFIRVVGVRVIGVEGCWGAVCYLEEWWGVRWHMQDARCEALMCVVVVHTYSHIPLLCFTLHPCPSVHGSPLLPAAPCQVPGILHGDRVRCTGSFLRVRTCLALGTNARVVLRVVRSSCVPLPWGQSLQVESWASGSALCTVFEVSPSQ